MKNNSSKKSKLVPAGIAFLAISIILPQPIWKMADSMTDGELKSIIFILTDVFRLFFFAGAICLSIGILRNRKNKREKDDLSTEQQYLIENSNQTDSDTKNTLSRNELIYINLPLFFLLIGVIFYEIKTDFILDSVVYPAALFFLVISIIFGSRPWWHYPLGMISILFILVILAMIIESLFGTPMIGGGCIKLLAAIGAALGIVLSLEVVALFIGVMCIALLVSKSAFNIGTIPSSPFILVSIICVYIWNFGFRFFESNEKIIKKPSELVEAANKFKPPSLPKSNEAELIRKASVLFNEQEFSNAIAKLSQALEINNVSDTAFYNRGVVFLKIGKKDKAIFDFKTAAKLGNKKAKELLNKYGITF